MIKRTPEQWRELFSQQAASGLSAQTFCSQNNLCAKYFSIRKKQLNTKSPKASSDFVRVVNASTIPTLIDENKSRGFIFRHGNSELYFNATPSIAWLAQLLRALQ